MIKLKELRTARGISQQELAELVGVSRQTISKWENGIVQPSADNLMHLSQVFQLPLEVFFGNDLKHLEQLAVEALARLPETQQDTDAEPVVTPVETPSNTDAEPAVTPADALPESVGGVLPPRHRNCRLWAALAAVIAVVVMTAGVISFNRWGDDSLPISGIGGEEVDEIPTMSGSLQPLQP